MSQPNILVIAATARELATPNGWRILECGIGPVEASIATAVAIEADRPLAILHVGIAGARRTAALAPATLIIGSASEYCDLHVPPTWAPSTTNAPPLLIEAAQRALPNALVRTIGTSATIGATTGVDVEAMEGFGVLRAAQRAGVPAIEVRAISNEIEEADRARWHFDAAFEAITNATAVLVAEIERSLHRA